MRILVVDDHEEVLELVGRALMRDQHQVSTATSAEQALSLLSEEDVELMIVDLGLPGASGLELCRTLRARGSEAAILILTAESAVASRVRCLDAGADDYLTKPLAVAELRARVRALSRRTRSVPLARIPSQGVELDFARRRALVNGKQVPVTGREWEILSLLHAEAGRVVPRSVLLERIWREGSDAAAASLEVLVGRIRKKLGEGIVRTVRGEGYAFGDE